MRGERYIVGLDIGTTKICAVVGRAKGNGADIIAYGLSNSSSMKKGIVIDIEGAATSIRRAIKEAESLSGLSIRSVYVGISGSHIKCLESMGAVGIKGGIVTNKDIEKVIDSASSVYIPLDREVVHVIPSDFIVDGEDGIRKPIGMTGVRLEAKVNIVTASQSALQNLLMASEKARLSVIETVFEPIATGKAVLCDEEKDAGVVLIDIGGSSTGLAVYRDGWLRHTSIIPIGGNHFTNDIAIGLRVGQKEAERLKKTYGYTIPPLTSEEMEVFDINGVSRKLPRRYIGEIIKPRCEELFELVRVELKDTMLFSAVLAGGGSLLMGIERIGEAILGIPVRTGSKTPLGLIQADHTPVYSTGIGLMLYGLEKEQKPTYEGVMNKVSTLFRGWRLSEIKQSIKVLGNKI